MHPIDYKICNPKNRNALADDQWKDQQTYTRLQTTRRRSTRQRYGDRGIHFEGHLLSKQSRWSGRGTTSEAPSNLPLETHDFEHTWWVCNVDKVLLKSFERCGRRLKTLRPLGEGTVTAGAGEKELIVWTTNLLGERLGANGVDLSRKGVGKRGRFVRGSRLLGELLPSRSVSSLLMCFWN